MASGGPASILIAAALLAPAALARAAGATGFSCTVESLTSGAECVLESGAPAVAPAGRARQARANVRAVATLAGRVCPQVARRRAGAAPDPDVRAFCARLFADEAPRCDAGGVRALVDPQGSFAPEARRCYAALVQAVARTRTVSASSARCCSCLAEARCIESFQSCAEDPLSVTADTGACAADRCAAACATFRPPPPPEGAAKGAARGEAAADERPRDGGAEQQEPATPAEPGDAEPDPTPNPGDR